MTTQINWPLGGPEEMEWRHWATLCSRIVHTVDMLLDNRIDPIMYYSAREAYMIDCAADLGVSIDTVWTIVKTSYPDPGVGQGAPVDAG